MRSRRAVIFGESAARTTTRSFPTRSPLTVRSVPLSPLPSSSSICICRRITAGFDALGLRSPSVTRTIAGSATAWSCLSLEAISAGETEDHFSGEVFQPSPNWVKGFMPTPTPSPLASTMSMSCWIVVTAGCVSQRQMDSLKGAMPVPHSPVYWL